MRMVDTNQSCNNQSQESSVTSASSKEILNFVSEPTSKRKTRFPGMDNLKEVDDKFDDDFDTLLLQSSEYDSHSFSPHTKKIKAEPCNYSSKVKSEAGLHDTKLKVHAYGYNGQGRGMDGIGSSAINPVLASPYNFAPDNPTSLAEFALQESLGISTKKDLEGLTKVQRNAFRKDVQGIEAITAFLDCLGGQTRHKLYLLLFETEKYSSASQTELFPEGLKTGGVIGRTKPPNTSSPHARKRRRENKNRKNLEIFKSKMGALIVNILLDQTNGCLKSRFRKAIKCHYVKDSVTGKLYLIDDVAVEFGIKCDSEGFCVPSYLSMKRDRDPSSDFEVEWNAAYSIFMKGIKQIRLLQAGGKDRFLFRFSHLD